MNERPSLKIIFAPIVIACALIIGVLIGRFYKNMGSEKLFYIYPRTDKLTNVLNYIEQEYVDPLNKEKIFELAIPKILAELDPHSLYIPAKELNEVNETLEGNFSGIGVQFNMLDDTLVIIKTIANGPSEKIGILAGDRIITVNKDTIAGRIADSDSIVSLLKGPRGTTVRVGIQRRNVNDLLDFDIIRDEIPLYSLDVAYMIKPGIGFIKLNKFSRTTFSEFSKEVISLLKQGMTYLILDLRGNGGGYLDAAVDIADQFLEENQLIVYTEGHSRPRQEYRASKGGLCQDVQLVILIDEESASASEILAGAIQDNDRGTIVGRRSFGKGLVQEQNLFSDGSAIRLTIARYYTPTGRCIQKPYENGNEEDYYRELSDRYLHGEFLEKDSIRFADSLKFTTPGGKIVYGGGGIMPDVFVPYDTVGITPYFISVRNMGIINRFALQYTDNHRKALVKFKDVNGFKSYLDKQNVMKQFIEFATQNNLPENTKEIEISLNLIKTQLYAFIIRNILDNQGFYPAIESIDNTLTRALEIIREKKELFNNN